MSVIDNIKGIMRSANIKSKEQQMGRDAVYIGKVESAFLTNYETFKVGLITWIEHILIDKGNRSMTVRPKKGTDASKYLRYTLEDPEIAEFYEVEQRVGGEFVYRVKEELTSLFVEDDLEELQETTEEDDNVLYV